MKLSHLFISSHLLISSIYLKKKFQVSDMGEWTDGDAMCSDTGEKIDIFVHIQLKDFPGKPRKRYKQIDM